MGDLATIRQLLRDKRKAIHGEQRVEVSQRCAERLMALLTNYPGISSVGVFLSLQEEIDTMPLCRLLWQQSFSVFLPIAVVKGASLQWRRYLPSSTLEKDAIGMLVPQKKEQVDRITPPDFIVMPLVGYDQDGNRIGMGGGYYDRTFSHKTSGNAPYLIGYAYQAQFYPKLSPALWDIPLDGLVNEAQTLIFNRS